MTDTDYTSDIICPYCGKKFNDSWQFNDFDGCEILCNDCDNDFILNVDVEVTYCTEKRKSK